MTIFESNLELDLFGHSNYHPFSSIDLSSLTPDMVGYYVVCPKWGVSVDLTGEEGYTTKYPRFPTGDPSVNIQVDRIAMIFKDYIPEFTSNKEYTAGEYTVSGNYGRTYKSKEFDIKLPDWLKYKAKAVWRSEQGDIK
jgi:hypothetical protein